MPVAKLTCPKCQAVLKPASPVPEGKKIKCPKCSTIFEARDDEARIVAKGSAAARGVQKKPAAPVGAKAKPAAPAAKKKPGDPLAAKQKPGAPAPAKKPYTDPDDDGPATYAVIHEPKDEVEDDDYDEYDEDDDNDGKPKIEYAPDLSVKDPRGPAQAAVIPPSNGVLFSGMISVILCMIFIGWCVWPMIFFDMILDPKDIDHPKLKTAKNERITKEYKELTKEQQAIVDEENDAEYILRWLLVGAGLFGCIYGGFIAYGGVKMQNLESYRWSMTAAIMSLFPLTFPYLPNVIFGVWALSVLRRPQVKAGFEARMADIY